MHALRRPSRPASRIAAAVVAAALFWCGRVEPAAAYGTAVSGGRTYVVNTTAGTVSVLDAVSGAKAVPDIVVGTGPRGCVLSPDGTRFYVANRDDDTVSVISTATNTVLDTIAVTGMGPEHLAIAPDGVTLYLTHQITSNVSVVDTVTRTETALVSLSSSNGSPRGLAVSPDGTKLYVVDRGASVVDVFSTATLQPAAPSFAVPSGPRDVRFSDDGTRALVVGDGAPVLVDVATDTPLVTSFGDLGQQRDLDVVGSTAYVANFQNTVLSAGAIDVYDLAQGTFVTSFAVSGRRPSAVAVDASGTCAFIAVQDDDQMRFLDLITGQEPTPPATTGVSPRCLSFLDASLVRAAPRFVPTSARLARNAGGDGVDRLDVVADLDAKDLPPTFTAAFALTVGDTLFDVPGLAREGRTASKLRAEVSGLRVRVRLAPGGAGRITLRFSAEGAFAASVDRDGLLTLVLRSGSFEAAARVMLDERDRYAAGKVGAVVDRELDLLSLRARVADPDRSAVRLTALFPAAEDGSVAADARFEIAGAAVDVPAALFVRRGRLWRARTAEGARIVVDAERGVLRVTWRRTTLAIGSDDERVDLAFEWGEQRFEGTVGIRRTRGGVAY